MEQQWPTVQAVAGMLDRDGRVADAEVRRLILADVITDRGVVEAVRVGYERGKGGLQGYDPTDATG